METLEEKQILFSDPAKEQQIEQEINQQRGRIQNAVDEFNAFGLKPLQPTELFYFIQGGYSWIENRFQSEQEVPKTWPKNADRSKFLEILTRPDYSKTVAALAGVSLMNPELFILKGDNVVIDGNVREQVVTRSRIYIEDSEQETYEKLKQLLTLLKDFNLLKEDSITRMTGRIPPVDFNGIGLGYVRYSEDPFQFNDLNKLKAFLQIQTDKNHE